MCFAARAPDSFAGLDLWCAGLAADCVRQPAPGPTIVFPRPDDYTRRRTVVDARVDVKALISAPRWVDAVLDGFARCLLLRGRPTRASPRSATSAPLAGCTRTSFPTIGARYSARSRGVARHSSPGTCRRTSSSVRCSTPPNRGGGARSADARYTGRSDACDEFTVISWPPGSTSVNEL